MGWADGKSILDSVIEQAIDIQQNFALFHCIGPSIQTALFNAPLVVIISWIMGKDMDLNFEIFMIALLVLSILVVGNFLRDGESNYLEGALLVVSTDLVNIHFPSPDTRADRVRGCGDRRMVLSKPRRCEQQWRLKRVSKAQTCLEGCQCKPAEDQRYFTSPAWEHRRDCGIGYRLRTLRVLGWAPIGSLAATLHEVICVGR